MRVKWCKLKNFRNYNELVVDFLPDVNLISGQNGQGKTNLVEAVMLCALSKSPRTSHDEELKLQGESHAEVEVAVERNFGEVIIKCVFDGETGKKFYVNSNEVKKVSDIFGNLVGVYFSPNDLRIVSESPAERRDFMDTDISQLSGAYYNLLQRYNKILFQRNKLLKTVRDRSLLLDQIEVWNEQLASVAGYIVKTRKNFIEKLKIPAKEIMKHVSKEADELEISYVGAVGETAEEIKAEILKSLRFNFERDVELGYTTVGPHRDDIKFELNNKDAKAFASQGQQRSIVLALKFAELKVFEAELDEKPVLVLDDVFSELDSSRQKKMYDKFEGCQVLMTGTVFRFKPVTDYLSLVVKNGAIKSKINQKKIENK